MSPAPQRDAEQVRIEELLAAQTHGTATEAENVELALYLEQDPQLQARIDRARRDGQVGEGWLTRVERDHEVQRAETSPRAQMERAAGLGMATLGTLLCFAAPAAGVPIMGMGFFVLLYSLIRVRIKTHAADPYKDIKR
ncbi:MAG: hypothetical protein AAF799_16370 [Myxococcota bacterium]